MLCFHASALLGRDREIDPILTLDVSHLPAGQTREMIVTRQDRAGGIRNKHQNLKSLEQVHYALLRGIQGALYLFELRDVVTNAPKALHESVFDNGQKAQHYNEVAAIR